MGENYVHYIESIPSVYIEKIYPVVVILEIIIVQKNNYYTVYGEEKIIFCRILLQCR